MSRTNTVLTSGRSAVRIATGALGFVGVTAVAGGAEMLLFPAGNVFVKHEWLQHLPVDDYRLPGAVLASVLGAGSLIAAYGLSRRPRWHRAVWLERATGRHWSWTATGVVGGALAGWIALEVVLIPERSAIEALYASLAVGLIGLCFTPSFRRALRSAR